MHAYRLSRYPHTYITNKQTYASRADVVLICGDVIFYIGDFRKTQISANAYVIICVFFSVSYFMFRSFSRCKITKLFPYGAKLFFSPMVFHTRFC